MLSGILKARVKVLSISFEEGVIAVKGNGQLVFYPIKIT